MSTGVEVRRGHELEALRSQWWCFLALGAVLVVLGGLAIGAPCVMSLVTAKLFAVLLIMGGIVQVVGAFWEGKWSGFLVHLLGGILYVIVGAMMLRNPVASLEVLTLLLAIFFIVGGIVRIVVSMQLQFHQWGWSLLSGFVSLFLGILIWSEFPGAALLWVGIFVGIEMIFNGWAWIMLGLDLRRIPA